MNAATMKFRRCAGAVAFAVAALAAAPAAAAEACVIGKWQPLGNAAAEWMRRNAPGINVAVANQQGTLEFRADGSYVAAGRAEASASASSGVRAQTRDARFQASGAWSASGATLTLRPARESVRGSMQMTTPDGRRIDLPMPSGAPAAQRMAYTCDGAVLETRTPMPNATPIIQRYRRVR